MHRSHYTLEDIPLSRTRIFFLLAATMALAVAFAACGGSSDSGSSDVPPQKVLDQTFSEKSTIDSGKADASLKIEANGDQSGNFEIDLSGPFDTNGSGDAKLDMTAKASGDVQGQNFEIEAGAIFTGDAGYLNYQGTDYALSSQQYASLSKALQQSSNGNSGQGNLPGLKDSLGDLTNEGETEVNGTKTIHVSGSVDPKKLTDAIKSAIDQGASGGVSQAQLQQLQGALPQLGQVTEAIKDASFDVYSGVDDHLLRKLDFNLDVAPPQGGELKITLDLSLNDVNKPQTIKAPSSSKPLNDLLRQLAPLLSGLAAPATGGGTTTPAPTGGTNSATLECLQNATTAAEVQACASQ